MAKTGDEKDDIYALASSLQAHSKKTDGFLREVVFSPLPPAVLFHDIQIQSLQRYCCQDFRHGQAILGIDATFNLGDFYVTVTTFRHPQLRRKGTKVSPVFMGPVIIHMQRRF